MLLRAGVHVRTSPPAPAGPWECVWRNKDGLRCHVGRVYDEAMFDADSEEYAQFNFPRKKPSTMTLIGGAVVTTTPQANMSVSRSGGFLTSSVKIKYKQNLGLVQYGDNDIVDVPDSGYAFWPEGKFLNAGETVYVILSRLTDDNDENPKWVLSLATEQDIWVYDFKLAAVAGTQCIQLWHSDIVYAKGGAAADPDHPFKCKIVDGKIKVTSGTVTGKIATAVGGGELDLPANYIPIPVVPTPPMIGGSWLVWIKITSTSTQFPVTVEVTSDENGPNPNSITESNVIIARGTTLAPTTPGGDKVHFIRNQFIMSSLWGEKVQFENFANYYFYRT